MASNIPSTSPIVPAMRNGELRILDTDLASRLGFAKPTKIRDLIKRQMVSLEEISTVPTVGTVIRGQNATEHYLNEEQALFITAKSETPMATKITIEIVTQFAAMKRGSTPAVPTSFREALLLAADQQAQIEAQERELAITTPKAEALDRIADTSGRTNLREVGKVLGIGSKRGIDLVREMGWIFRSQSGKWNAYSGKVDAGLVDVKYTTYTNTAGEEVSTQQVFVTPKGMVALSVKLGKN